MEGGRVGGLGGDDGSGEGEGGHWTSRHRRHLLGAAGGLLSVLLHEAVDLEPVGPPPVPAARLGHPNRQALLEPAGLAGGSVPLVDDTDVIVLAVGDHCLVVTESAEEGLAALTSEGSEVEARCLLITDPAELVLERVDVVDLFLAEHVVSCRELEHLGYHDDCSL